MSNPLFITHLCEGNAFFVGDIHGEYHQLMRSLEHVGFNPDGGDQLYSVGDLIDRGEYSERCLTLLEEPWFHAVKGNHEAMMLATLDGDAATRAMWQSAGGEWFGKLSDQQQQQIKQRYQQKLAALPLGIEVQVPHQNVAIGMVHADLPHSNWAEFRQACNNETLTDHQRKKCLWSRSTLKEIDRGHRPDDVTGIDAVILGHTPLPMFRSHGKRVWLDTGAGYSTGSLTILSAHQIVHMLVR